MIGITPEELPIRRTASEAGGYYVSVSFVEGTEARVWKGATCVARFSQFRQPGQMSVVFRITLESDDWLALECDGQASMALWPMWA